ncbi:MAG: class I SAM-dependent methyltransferase [Pseudomonadota bacterium]
MSDKETVAVYDAKAEEYAKLVSIDKPDQDLQRFMDTLPNGGRVLDWGCGPANSAAMMRQAGFDVVATDASAEMVRLAKEKFNFDVRQEKFEALTEVATFDAIWSNFALLHAPREDFPKHLSAARKALKPSGIFHLGMKLGHDQERDAIGRFYVYYSLHDLKRHLETAGFTVAHERQGKTVGLSGQTDPFAILLCNA